MVAGGRGCIVHTCIHKPQAILCASSCLHCPHCHCHLPAQLPLPAQLQFATASIVAILHCNRLAIAQPKTCLPPPSYILHCNRLAIAQPKKTCLPPTQLQIATTGYLISMPHITMRVYTYTQLCAHQPVTCVVLLPHHTLCSCYWPYRTL